ATLQSMQDHTGIWRDPWFGDVSLCPAGDRVRFTAANSPRLRGTVMRANGRFLVDRDDDSVDAEAWLEFAAADGDAALMSMAKVDPQADFSFDYEDLAFIRNGRCN